MLGRVGSYLLAFNLPDYVPKKLATWGDKASEMVNQFAFAKKITIVKGTGLIDNVALLETLTALSEIRNGMAHNLVPQDPLALVGKLPQFPDDPVMRDFLSSAIFRRRCAHSPDSVLCNSVPWGRRSSYAFVPFHPVCDYQRPQSLYSGTRTRFAA
jgi:hypothetical protein